MKQIRDRDYRFVSLTNPAYLQVAADGSLVDSKGREIWIEQTFELTQGVFTGVVVPELAAEDDVELVGGSVPPGMNSQLGIPLCGPDGWCLSLIRGIVGVPIKAKDYVAVFRITAGENKKRIAILTFKVKAADLDFGNYFGVLKTASSVAYRAGDALEIPVFAAVAPWSFGGVLRIRPDRTVELGKSYDASVFDSSAALDWYGSPFGGLRLVPAGGYYNTVFGASPLSASAWATGFYLLPQPDGSVESRPFAINAE